MRKSGLLVLSVLSCAVFVQAAETPESARSSSELQYSGAQPYKASQYVSLRGDVDLRGFAFVPQGSSFVSVNLSGNANVSSLDGRIRSNYAPVSQHASLFISQGQNHVSQYVHVNTTVSLYKDGRYVGSAPVSGSVYVSGWLSGNSLNLSGRGSVNGSVFVQEDDRQEATSACMEDGAAPVVAGVPVPWPYPPAPTPNPPPPMPRPDPVEECKKECISDWEDQRAECQHEFPGDSSEARRKRELCYESAADVLARCQRNCEGR
ncbi:MAG: hypothetical protein WC728_10840 [Elusimicrobiota bacterium]